MTDRSKLVRGAAVVISNPRSFHGGGDMWRGRKGRLKSRRGGFCVLVLEGEKDELGFFASELDMLE